MSVAGGFEMLVCYLVCSYQRLSHHTLVTVHVESTYLLAWCQLRTSANPAAVPYTDLSLARQRPTSLFLVGLCRQAEIDTTAVLLRQPAVVCRQQPLSLCTVTHCAFRFHRSVGLAFVRRQTQLRYGKNKKNEPPPSRQRQTWLLFAGFIM